MTHDPIAITGVGLVTAIGIGNQEYFDGLLSGHNGVTSLADRTDGDVTPDENEPVDGVWVGAPITAFEPKKYVRPRKALKVMCREIQIALASAHLALEHAGIEGPLTDDGALSPSRVGTVYGSELYYTPPADLVDSIRSSVDEAGEVMLSDFGAAVRRDVMPLWMLKFLPNMPACQVSIAINAQGPSNTLVAADASGPNALAEAISYLQRDLADLVLCGSSGTRIGALRLAYHGDLPTVQRGERSLEHTAVAHGREACGVVGGEGAASLTLEPLTRAQQRGATVMGIVSSIASRFVAAESIRSGTYSGELHPKHSKGSAPALKLAIQAALEQADLTADQIGAVVSHAVGELGMDQAERTALAETGINAPLVAPYASLGHTGAASGMIELATAALITANNQVPPTRNADLAAEDCFLQTPQFLKQPHVLALSQTCEGAATAAIISQP
ncbi:MAG: hypothetical protein CBB71_09120 [Rhodopirellula sp. TMED11]|nr:MAG: hypothetical protein CBB71_09120 [Rhodopirellula sp. TMED11]